MEYVIFKNKKFEIKEGQLKIDRSSIRRISEIEGLEKLTDLKELDLIVNSI